MPLSTHALKSTLGLILYVLLLAQAIAQSELTEVKEIRKLSLEEARSALPVKINGQVAWINPSEDSFFLYDEFEKGLFVRGARGSQITANLKGGEMIQLHGVSGQSGFMPEVIANKIEVSGQKPRPDGRSFYDHEFLSAAVDSEWVKLRGRLISMSIEPDINSIILDVSRNNLEQRIKMPYSKYNEDRLTEIMFAFVEFSAVCGTVFNKKRQMVGRVFYAHSSDDFTPLVFNEHNFSDEKTPIHELFSYGSGARREVVTHGVVIHSSPHELYLRGKQACLKVSVYFDSDVKVGDEVEITGVISPQPISPAFRARSAELIRELESPIPVRVEQYREIDASLNYELIEIDVELLETAKSLGEDGEAQQALICRFSDQLLEILLPTSIVPPEELQPGATLRLTGICHLKRNEGVSWDLRTEGFSIEPRSARDIVTLNNPPWWNTSRLLWLLGILITAFLLFLVWAGLLQRTVGRQTEVIRKNVERETLHDERQRIARELHDNLLQGLVGMAIQLRTCFRGLQLSKAGVFEFLDQLELPQEKTTPIKSEIEDRLESNRQALVGVQTMLDRCNEESRTSVLSLRGKITERMELIHALKDALEPCHDEPNVKLKFHIEGEPRELQEEVERNILLATKELVTNAIKHASAKHIDVYLSYSRDGLIVDVTDDGIGFSVDHPPKKGHYGLQGIRERMEQFGAIVEIDSIPGRGTEVIIKMDSLEQWEGAR